MKTNFSMLFYMKKPKDYEAGSAPIYLRITVSGQRSEITTGRECEPSRWNSRAGRADGTKEEIRAFNAFLDDIRRKVYEAHRQLSENDELITAETLKNKLIGKETKTYMLMEVFQEHNQKMMALAGKDFSPTTCKRYETSFKHTQDYLKYQYGINDIDIRKINNAFVANYDYYLRSVRKCSNNTVVKYLRNFGKIIRICLANGWIVANPFANYKSKVKVVERVFLTQDEIQKMANKEFASDRLTQVRDVFLFCCFTGLAYVDIQKLKTTEIQKGIDGERWIFINRKKTDTRSAIPLLPSAVKLIDKYSNHPFCIHKNMPLPVPSNQKMNDYLKEISAVCGIEKTLTSHIARHTFATTVTLSNGVPIESVSKMLGHSSIRQTQHYAKILDIKVSADMLLLKEKLQMQQLNNNEKKMS
jgi:site-specific recombinase XerD